MNNEPHQPKWDQPSSQPQWQSPPAQFDQPQPPPQYGGQAQWDQQQQPQWGQPPTQYSPPQQYGANQYQQYGGVPSYAQVQPQQQQVDNLLTRWLAIGIAIRIAMLVIVPLVLCGGCAMLIYVASLTSH